MMTTAPDRDDPRGWARAVNELLDRIDNGSLKPGGKVPSRSRLSAELGVSIYSVGQATGWLSSKRILRQGPGHSFVLTSSARERASALTAGPRSAIPVVRTAISEARGTEHAASPLAWVRIANLAGERVSTGEYTGRMPPLNELAAETGVSRRTVARAYRHLAEHEKVYRIIGHGYYADPKAVRAATGRAIGRDELVLAWGAEWAIDHTGQQWRARRLNVVGEVLIAATPAELNALIRADMERAVALR